jgi:multiple sugar transport system permease protein
MKTRRPYLILSYVIIVGTITVFLFPIVWLIISSLKPPAEVLVVSLPTRPTLQNYQNVLDQFPVTNYLKNSLRLAVVSTLVSLTTGSLAAYGLSKYRFHFRQPLLIFTLVVRMIPGVALGVPLFWLFSRADLKNTFQGIVLAHTAIQLPLTIWIMVGFFEDIPSELSDAGLVDGCNRLNVIYFVILPLAAPGAAVAGIFAFLTSWNNFDLSLMLNSAPDLLTMPVGMSQMNLLYGIRWDSLSAAAVMYIVPTIILALLLQRYIVRGLTAGAIKG